MAAVPATITVGPLVYTTAFDKRLMDAHNCWGRIEYGRQVITLDPEQGADHLAVTLWHEVKHACDHFAGFADASELKEEDVVSRQSPIELMVLRDNPELLAYLLNPSTTEEK